MQPSVRTTLLVILIAFGLVLERTRLVLGQQIEFVDPPAIHTAAEQLLMEQVQQLSTAGEFDEALVSLEKLLDQAGDALVLAGESQRAGTQVTRRFVPMREWVAEQTQTLLMSWPERRPQYQATVDGLAMSVYEQQRLLKDPEAVRRAADRYSASKLGGKLNLLLADIYLEYGWGIAAVQAIQRAEPDLRFDLMGLPKAPAVEYQPTGTLGWPLVWSQSAGSPAAQSLLQDWGNQDRILDTAAADRSLLPEAMHRLISAVQVDPASFDAQGVHQWASVAVRYLPPAIGETVQPALTDLGDRLNAAQRPDLVDASVTFAMNRQRAVSAVTASDAGDWPVWSQALARYSTSNDRTIASRPRAGEQELGALCYHPAVYDGKVFVNELTRIVAYDAATGRAWPEVESNVLPLFDSQVATAAYLPLGYPFVGVPRGTLSIEEGCLYARMGSPVTGWSRQQAWNDGNSRSYLVGLDLSQQGSMLQGFPLRLSEDRFPGAEFEGAPLIWGELLLVAIAQRDNVGVRRSVAAFERLGGGLVWHSKVLASDVVHASEDANIIANQLLTMSGGRLYYGTNMGAIVCLDPLHGEIIWQTQYARPDMSRRDYPRPDRFRYRDLAPCMVEGGVLYCAPQDCAEIFALDVTTGDLVWSTDDQQVADVVHLLGVYGDNLLVSGDRLVWIDRLSGRVLGRFPGATTPGVSNALPSPRGLGRGVLAGGEVWFPVAGEILVFSAQLAPEHNALATGTPRLLRRVPIGTRGREGGNLLVESGRLFYASPSRLLMFE
ncbi:outer membrane biogenesis protein BamB [Aureliella helgolandensis]|uniref:Outer membrane biogenesis protein BamB n=2 Tax=Aureliella helgolandensis TaxID=2527968 RepID=A0A518GH72_9BACT|nr:outer membrane biogenesis protein BamB [Aureliella helgolandensis]